MKIKYTFYFLLFFILASKCFAQTEQTQAIQVDMKHLFFSGNGEKVFGIADKTAYIWDVRTGLVRQLKSFGFEFNQFNDKISISDSGKYLAFHSNNNSKNRNSPNTLIIINTFEDRIIYENNYVQLNSKLIFNTQESYLIYSREIGNNRLKSAVEILDINTLKTDVIKDFPKITDEQSTFDDYSHFTINEVAISADGKLLSCYDSKGIIRIYERETKQLAKMIRVKKVANWSPYPNIALAFHEDNSERIVFFADSLHTMTTKDNEIYYHKQSTKIEKVRNSAWDRPTAIYSKKNTVTLMFPNYFLYAKLDTVYKKDYYVAKNRKDFKNYEFLSINRDFEICLIQYTLKNENIKRIGVFDLASEKLLVELKGIKNEIVSEVIYSGINQIVFKNTDGISSITVDSLSIKHHFLRFPPYLTRKVESDISQNKFVSLSDKDGYPYLYDFGNMTISKLPLKADALFFHPNNPNKLLLAVPVNGVTQREVKYLSQERSKNITTTQKEYIKQKFDYDWDNPKDDPNTSSYQRGVSKKTIEKRNNISKYLLQQDSALLLTNKTIFKSIELDINTLNSTQISSSNFYLNIEMNNYSLPNNLSFFADAYKNLFISSIGNNNPKYIVFFVKNMGKNNSPTIFILNKENGKLLEIIHGNVSSRKELDKVKKYSELSPSLADIDINRKDIFEIKNENYSDYNGSDFKRIFTESSLVLKNWNYGIDLKKWNYGYGYDFLKNNTRKNNLIISSSGQITDIATQKEIATIQIFDSANYLITTPDRYYYGTRKAIENISFYENGKYFTFDQFDVRYNRPDIIMKRLGYLDSLSQKNYDLAYQKRFEKMGINANVSEDLPEINILNRADIPLSINIHQAKFHNEQKYWDYFTNKKINVELSLKSTTGSLKKILVWVNGIPLYGKNGKDISSSSRTMNIDIPLSEGFNKIQIACSDENNNQSFAETFNVLFEGKEEIKRNLYVIGIGITEHNDKNIQDLTGADNDIRQFVKSYTQSQENKSTFFNQIFIDTLINKNATVQNIKALKEKLAKSNYEDHVILFYSSHGKRTKDLDYYLYTHNTKSDDISQNSISYEELEDVLDGIPARKKLILLNACEAGEIDEDVEALRQMKTLFEDLRRGNGTTVITSSENTAAFTLNSKNQTVFGYALMNFLNENKGNAVTTTGLLEYMKQELPKLTRKKDYKPSIRQEVLETDSFRIK